MKGWHRAALLGIGAIACQYVAAAPTIQHWTTANGARVYFVEAPEIPIVDLRVVFAAGSARDDRIKGIANLTNALLKEGAGDLDVDAFSKKFSATGAKLGVAVARDMAYATVKTLSEPKYAEPALALFEQVLGSPRSDAASIERLKARMLVALKRKQQSPGTIAQDTFFEQVYADHPYASSPDGSEASVAAITRADILAHYDKYYVAQNAIVAIVGALGVDEAKALADDVTAGLDAGERAAALPEVVSPQSAQLEHIEFPSIQSHVRVGLPGMRRGDPDYFPLLVGNHALGGNSLVSILFREIRSKRGLSYSAYSYFMPMAKRGPFVAALQTDRSQQDEALQVLKETIEGFVTDGPPPEDLLAAKKNLIGGFPLRIDSNSKTVEYIAMIGFYDLPLDYLDTFTDNVEAVTGENVREAFARRVDPSKLVTVVVGRAAEEPES